MRILGTGHCSFIVSNTTELFKLIHHGPGCSSYTSSLLHKHIVNGLTDHACNSKPGLLLYIENRMWNTGSTCANQFDLESVFCNLLSLPSHFAGQHSLARLTCGGEYVTMLRNRPNVRACCGFWLHVCSTWGSMGMYYDFLSVKIGCSAR